MKFYLLIFLSLIAFVFQILFSFYYSSSMVELNHEYNQNQDKLESLQIKDQDLKLELSSLTSTDYLLKNAAGLTPITKTFP